MSIIILIFVIGSLSVRGPVLAESCGKPDILVYALPYTFDEFSYFDATSYATQQWQQAINAGLYSRRSALNRAYGPDLASSMPTVSENGLNWTVDLKSGILFENGNEITADDVIFTYRMLLTPEINKNTYSTLVSHLDNSSIVKIDEDTIQFNFKTTYAFGLSILSEPIYDKMVYQEAYDQCIAGDGDSCNFSSSDGNYTRGSAGPYRFTNITSGSVYLDKNENYWDPENVWADSYVFRTIETKEQALYELPAGNIDILDAHYMSLPSDYIGLTGLSYGSISAPKHEEISLNHLNPYFGNGELVPDNGSLIDSEQARLVRKAMSHIVNRDYIVDEILDGVGYSAATAMPSVSIGWDSSIAPDNYDIMAARDLMEQAGFNFSSISSFDVNDADAVCGTTGNTADCFFEITVLSSNTNPVQNQWSALYVTELPKIGIGVKEHASVDDTAFRSRTTNYPLSTLVPGFDQGGFDIAFTGYSWGLNWDPSGRYTNSGLCSTGDCENYYNYVNSTIETQINDYLTNINITSRNEMVADLQAMLDHEKPEIVLVHPQDIWAWAGDVLGLDLLLLSAIDQEFGNVRKASWPPCPRPPPPPPDPPTSSEIEPMPVQFAIMVVSIFVMRRLIRFQHSSNN